MLTSMSDTLLSIRNLIVEFSTDDEIVRAVDNISLDIPAGKTVGLVGESGSGKSITAFSIMQLIPKPAGKILSGQILFEGNDLTKYSEEEMRKIRGNQISMIFQEPMTALNPVYTVGNQIDEALILHQGMNKKEARKRTIELLNEVGIPTPKQKVNDYPHQMSGGQKQRVMIAMAMACRPKLLICDEPTTALDVTIQKQVLELMIALQKKHAMSMLFITHDLGVIAEIADHVTVMYQGKLVEQNKTKDLFAKPQKPYTKGLLACRPSLEKTYHRLLTVEHFLNNEKQKAIEKKTNKTIDDNLPVMLEVQGLKKYFPIKGGF